MRLSPAVAAVATAVALTGCGGATKRTGAGRPASTAASTVAAPATGTSPTEPDPTGALVPANPAPVVQAEFSAPLGLYRVYVDRLLAKLRPQLARLQTTAASGDLSAAEHDWLEAHITWLELGQDDNEYGAFGKLGERIDGKADGLPGTTSNPSFTGFHKVEMDLWQKHDADAAARDARVLGSLVGQLTPARVARDLPDTVNSVNAWVLRAHEILEDGLRDSLSQADDYGSNSDLTSLAADVEATREMLIVLTQPLEIQSPKLLPAAGRVLNQLDQSINAAGGPLRLVSLTSLPLRTRLTLDQATSAAVETLAPISELMHDTVPGAG